MGRLLVKARGFFFSAVILFSTNEVSASDVRTETLGNSNFFIQDDNNIWLFPATILDNSDLFLFSLGGEVTPETGESDFLSSALFALPNRAVFGASFSDDKAKIQYAPFNPNHQSHLFYGRRFGKNKFAIRFSRYAQKSTISTSLNRSAYKNDLEIGIGSNSGKGWLSDLTIRLTKHGFNESRRGEKLREPDGTVAYGLRARGFISLSDEVNLVPLFTFNKGTNGVRFFSSGIESSFEKQKSLLARLGLGFNIAYSEDLFVIAHASLIYSKIDHDRGTTSDSFNSQIVTWNLPSIGLGVERLVTRWLVLRAGATAKWTLIDEEQADGAVSIKSSSSQTFQSFGLALKHDGFQLDLAINSEAIEVGPYFLTGYELPLFSKVTVFYKF